MYRFAPTFRSTSLAVLLFLSGIALADRSVEDAVEATSTQIILPGTGTGPWTFPICSGCTTQTVKLDDKSKFFVGNKQVSLDDLRKFVNSNGPHSMTIFYRWTDQMLTRIVVDN